ncbi:hypothetical protein BJV82DRAFT_593365 [Fennellomyces sp. T-0311]|nr:hypothetical protein BJV82DRAFT_593365 [Fennellomyces sp. T-0311]
MKLFTRHYNVIDDGNYYYFPISCSFHNEPTLRSILDFEKEQLKRKLQSISLFSYNTQQRRN